MQIFQVVIRPLFSVLTDHAYVWFPHTQSDIHIVEMLQWKQPDLCWRFSRFSKVNNMLGCDIRTWRQELY